MPTDFSLLLMQPPVCNLQGLAHSAAGILSLRQMWMGFVGLELKELHRATSWVASCVSGVCCQPTPRLHPQREWLSLQLALLRSVLLQGQR